MVWGENISGGQPANPPSVGVAMWKDVLPCDLLRWTPDNPPDFNRYDVYLVNIFQTDDSTHCEQIRRARPDALIVGMVDPKIDLVLLHPEWTGIWQQLSFCDVIGGRTPSDCAVYGAFFHKPTVWMPSPIHPLDYFAELRDTPKDDFILAQDHPMNPSPSAHNVAALAAIQRATGLDVIYAAARDWTPDLAKRAGLRATFAGHVPFFDFIGLTARARLMVDLYLFHSYGRQNVLAAAVGTPVVGSSYTLPTGHPQVDPLNPQQALKTARMLLDNPGVYRHYQQRGYEAVERDFGVDACRARVRQLIARYARAAA